MIIVNHKRMFFCPYRKAEMKQRHEEIRQKYGEPFDYFGLNCRHDGKISEHFFAASFSLYVTKHLSCVLHQLIL